MTFEYKLGGRMIGTEDAIDYLETFVADAVSQSEVKLDSSEFDYMVNRFKYLANRVMPIKPKYLKGKYGKKYDSYSCGGCGFTVHYDVYTFCPKCGREIDWR